MSKITLVLAIVIMWSPALPSWANDIKCHGATPEVSTKWLDMQDKCISTLRDHIQMEVDASYTYLAMAAFFSRDNVNMPGFAKLFFHSASQRRSQALELIEYLLMRGNENYKLIKGLIKTPQQEKLVWGDPLEALKDALETEVRTTKNIEKVITVCDEDRQGTDHHLVKYLSSEILSRQYKLHREIAGRIATLSKTMRNSAALGSFLFDKELLK